MSIVDSLLIFLEFLLFFVESKVIEVGDELNPGRDELQYLYKENHIKGQFTQTFAMVTESHMNTCAGL